MKIAFILMLLAQEEAQEGVSSAALRFLARHQLHDGSWGSEPDACRCALPPPAAPGDLKQVPHLIELLGSEDIDARDRAQKALRDIGAPAVPLLRAAAEGTDSEVVARSRLLLGILERPVREPGDVELTGLVVLAFMNAGYSHLSMDTYDGLNYGEAVKKGLLWLLARQDEEGVFTRKDPAANAVAACAVLEAYGMTGATLFKEPAEKAIRGVKKLAPDEPTALIWTLEAFLWVRLNEMGEFPQEEAARLLELLRRQPGIRAQAGVAAAEMWVHRVRIQGDWMLRLRPEDLDPGSLHEVDVAFHQILGCRDPGLSRWRIGMKQGLARRQDRSSGRCERGSWPEGGLRGRLEGAAYNTMTGLVCRCFGCRSPFR